MASASCISLYIHVFDMHVKCDSGVAVSSAFIYEKVAKYRPLCSLARNELQVIIATAIESGLIESGLIKSR